MLDMPGCQMCKKVAKYDAKTKMGPWAYVCSFHFVNDCVIKPGLAFELYQNDAIT
jgi:hypothetical protein